jgi:DNA-binding transcriptional regulator YiaG
MNETEKGLIQDWDDMLTSKLYWQATAQRAQASAILLLEAVRLALATLDSGQELDPAILREARAQVQLGPYLAKYGNTLPEALREWEDLHGRQE